VYELAAAVLTAVLVLEEDLDGGHAGLSRIGRRSNVLAHEPLP